MQVLGRIQFLQVLRLEIPFFPSYWPLSPLCSLRLLSGHSSRAPSIWELAMAYGILLVLRPPLISDTRLPDEENTRVFFFFFFLGFFFFFFFLLFRATITQLQGQHQTFDSLTEARDRTRVLMDPSWVYNLLSHNWNSRNTPVLKRLVAHPRTIWIILK